MHNFSARRLASLLVLAGAVAAVTPARADTLVGTTATGVINVRPGSLATLTQAFNTPVTIGSGSFQGSFAVTGLNQSFDLSATFTDSGLALTIMSPLSYSNYTDTPSNLFTLVFSDAAFTGSFGAPSFSCAADPFATCAITGNGLVSQSLSNGVLSLMFDNAAAGQVYNFAYTPAATTGIAAAPEPASLVLAGTALLGMAGTVRRRIVG